MSTRDLAARPMCGVCGVLVERLTEEDDGDEVVFTAICHGDRDRERVRAELAAVIVRLDFGVAFATATRRLGATP